MDQLVIRNPARSIAARLHPADWKRLRVVPAIRGFRSTGDGRCRFHCRFKRTALPIRITTATMNAAYCSLKTPVDIWLNGPAPQSVILEVPKAIGLALEDFHFSVETFSDPVVAGEAPHGGNLLGPGLKCVAQRDQLRQAGLPERSW